jgi:hypothetical protein
MEAIGFFRQLRHGLPKGPDLHAAIKDPLPVEERGALAEYLRRCPVFDATSDRGDDVLDPSKREVSAINTHTDGEYLWPEDLAYYVETYGARPPADFLDHVKHARDIPEFEPGMMQRLEPLMFAAVEELR